MTIDRLGPVEPVGKIDRTHKFGKVANPASSDLIDVSEEAKRSAALKQTADIVRATPDIRMDRVEEVKMKLKDDSYMNDAVIESIADSILDVFGV